MDVRRQKRMVEFEMYSLVLGVIYQPVIDISSISEMKVKIKENKKRCVKVVGV